MKKLIYPIIAVIAIFSLSSCNFYPFNKKEGEWSDNIRLSQKLFTISSQETTVTVTTKGTSWWFDSFELDGKYDLNDVDGEYLLGKDVSKRMGKDAKFEHESFVVERKNGNIIQITMHENKTGKERELILGLQAGNYFDNVRMVQK